MIWSCLQGCMGHAIADQEEAPRAAQIVVGDFCFFAGEPQDRLICQAGAPILVPKDEAWARRIEAVLGQSVQKSLRYAICKEPDRFDREKLRRFAQALEPSFSLRVFDRDLYHQAMAEPLVQGFLRIVSGFCRFPAPGIGGRCGAGGPAGGRRFLLSVYHGGIEIQIATQKAYRRRGLATACAQS